MSALVWDGCVNVRDLGGLPTADGRVTAFGRYVRADNIRRLSDDGWRTLVEHGVTRIVDLRMGRARALDPPRDVPVEVVTVSVLGEWDDETQAFYDGHLDASDGVVAYLVWSYLHFLERYRGNFARAVEAIGAVDDGAVVVHCMGGKDRTGLVSALILRLAGVEVAVAAADYALSEANLAPGHAAWVAQAVDQADRRRREVMGPTPAEVMAEVLEAVEARYGSAEEYLRGGGVTAGALARIRERLAAP